MINHWPVDLFGPVEWYPVDCTRSELIAKHKSWGLVRVERLEVNFKTGKERWVYLESRVVDLPTYSPDQLRELNRR